MSGITQKQLDMLRHSLGLDYQAKPFRNHFATYPEGDDAEDCRTLERLGYMRLGRTDTSISIFGDMLFYHVTDAGKAAAGIEPARAAGEGE